MRALMLGGGCRGLTLARALVADGHAVRAVTRSEARREEIEAAGAQCVIGDPDVVGTLRYALDNVTVLLHLLATASGPPEVLDALHGSRLRMLLEKSTDTTVRGVVYEGRAGESELERARSQNELLFELITADARDQEAWLPAARAAITAVLAAPRGGLHSQSLLR
jgi:uncharacterized protein YbjT (DUF2867 family)